MTKYIRINNEIYTINETNTIQELCDEFVVINKDLPNRPVIIYPVDIIEFVKNNKNLCDIYGAIWTDKGLKYIAKMNDNGELELI